MVKAEWGAKHGCPKCGTRFYDLGKDDPVSCVAYGTGKILEEIDTLRKVLIMPKRTSQ